MSNDTWFPAQQAALLQTFPEYRGLSPSEFQVLLTRFPSAFEQYQRAAPTSEAEARYPSMFKRGK